MSDELRNCPFCGGVPCPANYRIASSERRGNYVRCMECHASTEVLDMRADAIAAWNRRAPSAATSSELRERVARAMCVASHAVAETPWLAALHIADAAIAAMREHEAAAPRWRHKKRGTVYVEIGRAELQAEGPVNEGETLVVYHGDDGKLWVRPDYEFGDGRFVPAAPAAAGDAT